MSDILFGPRVLSVEVATIGEQFRGGPLPRTLTFFPLLPPRQAIGEFLKLYWSGLGVVLPAFRKGLFVIPHIPSWPGSVEEQQICRNARIWRKYPIRQSDDRVRVELFQQLFLNPRAHSVTKEDSVRYDHAAPAALRTTDRPSELAHDKLQE